VVYCACGQGRDRYPWGGALAASAGRRSPGRVHAKDNAAADRWVGHVTTAERVVPGIQQQTCQRVLPLVGGGERIAAQVPAGREREVECPEVAGGRVVECVLDGDENVER